MAIMASTIYVSTIHVGLRHFDGQNTQPVLRQLKSRPTCFGTKLVLGAAVGIIYGRPFAVVAVGVFGTNCIA